MNTKKTVKKSNSKKYAFVVDLTNAETYEDVIFAFAKAKAKAGVKLTDKELNILTHKELNDCVNTVAIAVASTMLVNNNTSKSKKKNVFKRFWNWITRKNK